jgi:tetratricopeptide (TPR) repeat protein
MSYVASMFNAVVKRHLFIFISILLICSQLSAQSRLVDSLKQQLPFQKNDTSKILFLRTLAFNLMGADPDEAWKYTLEMLQLSEEKDFPKGTAMATDIQGSILRGKGSYMEAIEKQHEAFRIYDSIGYKYGLRSTLSNIGLNYFALKNYKKALECFQKAYSLDTFDHYIGAKILNNIGMVYYTTGQYQKAIQVYLKVLPFAETDSTYAIQSVLYSGLSISYAYLDQLEKAVQYMLTSIKYVKLSGNKDHYAGSFITLGGYYINLKDYAKAKYYLNQGYKIAREINAKAVIVSYYRNMAYLHKQQHLYKEAYSYLDKYTELNDSLITEEQVNKLSEMESKFQVDIKNSELIVLNKDKQLKESELKQQKKWRYLLILLLSIVCVLLFISYRNVKLKQQVNKNLEAENLFLQNEHVMAQYETLRNQINPHFLFNSLNALATLIKSDPDNAVEFTTIFSRLYRSVLELKDHSVITLSEELRLVEDYIYLQKIRFAENLHIERTIKAEFLKDYVPPFCIQMLIENAIKHNIISDEFPLYIRLYTQGDWFVVTNTIKPRTNKLESTGVGIKNIQERYRIMSNKVPEFSLKNDIYIAKIPLLKE